MNMEIIKNDYIKNMNKLIYVSDYKGFPYFIKKCNHYDYYYWLCGYVVVGDRAYLPDVRKIASKDITFNETYDPKNYPIFISDFDEFDLKKHVGKHLLGFDTRCIRSDKIETLKQILRQVAEDCESIIDELIELKEGVKNE